MLEVLYHRAKFGGALISLAAGAAKNVAFLSVCLSVCLSVTLLNVRDCAHDFAMKALELARLVLGWVTVFGGQTTSVFHQATQANSASYPQRNGK